MSYVKYSSPPGPLLAARSLVEHGEPRGGDAVEGERRRGGEGGEAHAREARSIGGERSNAFDDSVSARYGSAECARSAHSVGLPV